jgi:hypothetical protein
MYRMYHSRLYAGIGRTPFQPATQRQLYWTWITVCQYIQNISYTQTWLRRTTWRMYQWLQGQYPNDYRGNIPMTTGVISQWSKGDDTFVLTRSLLLFSFLKLIQINIILSDNVNILYIYTVTPVLTKPWILYKPIFKSRFNVKNLCVNLTCINWTHVSSELKSWSQWGSV